ncbi:unnamed protein product [Arctogadus glacialis]
MLGRSEWRPPQDLSRALNCGAVAKGGGWFTTNQISTTVKVDVALPFRWPQAVFSVLVIVMRMTRKLTTQKIVQATSRTHDAQEDSTRFVLNFRVMTGVSTISARLPDRLGVRRLLITLHNIIGCTLEWAYIVYVGQL